MVYYYMKMSFLIIGLNLMMVLVSLSFFTLLERKVLGFIQNRKGPNKLGFMGILQPFSDAIKLFSKEFFFLSKLNKVYFTFSPIFSLFFMMIIWICLPNYFNLFFMNYSLIYMFCCLSIGTYPLMMSGWSSNSNYSLLGAIRSICQMISYEVMMIIMFICLVILTESYDLLSFLNFQIFMKFMIFMFPFILIMIVSLLAELNRTPSDLVEGESELVSGFNVEFSGGLFAMIFMAEYGMIMFMSIIYIYMFFGIIVISFIFYIFYIFICFLIVWFRGTLPRIRYDELMYLCWKSFLMIILNYLFFILGVKYFYLLF
uniref:NADH-ubiquinone oxidoreductase chain 1 n=1 Tax=Dryinus sp. ZJUH_2016011 TaxID=2491175 RepID=A0A3S8V0K3_9HYME|nr:NADH dehydrogenase subunit 1 [Dryinus sp. ZJUH_2016011]